MTLQAQAVKAVWAFFMRHGDLHWSGMLDEHASAITGIPMEGNVMRKVAYAVAALLIVVSATASAASQMKPTAGPLDVSRPADVVASQISAIRADLAKGEDYSEISADNRAKVSNAMTRIERTIETRGSTELSADEQVTVFNDQEVVNTVLTSAKDDSRMVCQRVRAVGSNMVTSQCMTVAQRREMRRNSERNMNDVQRSRPLPER